MPRPRKWRTVCCMPPIREFAPVTQDGPPYPTVSMTVDEYETLRLIDYEGLSQEECGASMQVARTTVQLTYASARRKIAQALVDGRSLRIEGGDYRLCGGEPHCGCHGCHHGHAGREGECDHEGRGQCCDQDSREPGHRSEGHVPCHSHESHEPGHGCERREQGCVPDGHEPGRSPDSREPHCAHGRG